jgi:hypothetical protein
MWVKWLRRIEVGDEPWHAPRGNVEIHRPSGDGKARRFTWEMDAKSVITNPQPAGADHPRGPTVITGVAWSGRGTIKRVDVTPRRWQELAAPRALDGPSLSISRCTGSTTISTGTASPLLLQSRAIDSDRPRAANQGTSCAKCAARTRSTTTTVSRPGRYGLGRAALPEEIAAWDIDIRPDGLGLPVGRGRCLDRRGRGVRRPTARPATATSARRSAAGRCWPAASDTLDPWTRSRPSAPTGRISRPSGIMCTARCPTARAVARTNDEVYAIVAYLLYLNNMVDDDFVLSNENFTEVEMPNEDGFFMDDRAEAEWRTFTGPSPA